MKFAFLCTTRPQAEMFLRVGTELERRGHQSALWVTADEFVTWSVEPFLVANAVEPVTLRSRNGKISFVDLPLHEMWWCVLRQLVPQLEALLAERRPDIVFVGNDRGLIEKQTLRIARSLGAKSILIQDGLLWRHEVRSYAARAAGRAGFRALARSGAKDWVARVTRAAGRPDLGPSYMGQGGCDRICVMGESTKKVLGDRGVDPAVIVVTGQPRYDGAFLTPLDAARLKSRLGVPPEHAVVSFFGATSDPDVRDSNRMHPPEIAAKLARIALGIRARPVSVILKPHPRESAEPYLRVAESVGSAITVCEERSIDLVQISDISVSFVCTTIAETVLCGSVPVVLSMGFAGSVADSLGVPGGALMEFADPSKMLEWVERALMMGEARESERGDAVRQLVHQPPAGAAAAVADVAEEMASEGASTPVRAG